MAGFEKKGQFKKEDDAPEYTSQAFSITNHPEGGYALVEIDYNPVTMHAKVKEVKKVGDSRADAEEYFRIRVGNYFAEIQAKS